LREPIRGIVRNMFYNKTILYLTVTEQTHRPIFNILGPARGDAANPINDFLPSLTDLFEKVISYDVLKRYCEIGVIETNHEICNLVFEERPQIVIWRAHDYQILESTFQSIRRSGAIVIAWYWDDHFRFDDFSKLYIPFVDYNVTCDKKAISKYERIKAKAFYYSGGCSGEYYYKKMNLPKLIDVSFVGSNIWEREQLIRQFENAGLQVDTYGRGWNSGKISFEEMLTIFNSSKINLNFAGVGVNNEKQLKGRIFEVGMCGGFLLSEYVKGIEDHFELEKEIVCFESVDEAIEKAHYYLLNDNKREKIATAFCNKVKNTYTWGRVLSSLFQMIEDDQAAKDGEIGVNPNLERPGKARIAAFNYHFAWAKAWLLQRNISMFKNEGKVAQMYDHGSRRLNTLLFLSNCLPLSLLRLIGKRIL
jgi:spore maturation protein CgeB